MVRFQIKLIRTVSIRSPHRSEGRFLIPVLLVVLMMPFQSAPPTEVRGDLRALTRCIHIS